MDDLLSEKEQIEALRSWWQENGRYVISGIVLGVAILVGWNQWQVRQQSTRLEASALFETVAGAVDGGDVDAAEAAALDLSDNYASTTYATLARLAIAKLYMDTGRDLDAVKTLDTLLTVRGHPELKMVGRLRLAKIYLYQEKYPEVVELLSGFEDTSFAAGYDELLGDAYAALGKVAEASAAYERAMMDDANLPTVNRAIVQMKIVDLPEDTVADEQETPGTDDVSEPAEAEEE